jgi:hypothetical protein
MSESKHTPGPWKDLGRFGEWPGSYRAVRACFTDGEGNRHDSHIAVIEEHHCTREAQQIAADNARLIASAPELLECCKDLRLKLLQFVGAVAEVADCSDDVEAIKRADSVIRKAEGGPS